MSSSAHNTRPELSTTSNGSSISRRPDGTAASTRRRQNQGIMADVAEPRISIVIPIYNEQESSTPRSWIYLRERLKPFGWNYEIILAENGSKDRTIKLGKRKRSPPSTTTRTTGKCGSSAWASRTTAGRLNRGSCSRAASSSSARRSISATPTSTARDRDPG